MTKGVVYGFAVFPFFFHWSFEFSAWILEFHSFEILSIIMVPKMKTEKKLILSNNNCADSRLVMGKPLVEKRFLLQVVL
jgi:hypothetical protein